MSDPPEPATCRAVALVPTLDNVGTIAEVVRGVQAQGLDVVVIDDGCTDGTPEAARAAGAEVLSHPHNLGKGAALLTGFRHAAEAGYSHAVTIDGDGQHLPDDLPDLLTAMREAPEAIIVGTRPRDAENVPRSSKVGRAISDFMLWASSARELRGERPDSQCGYRIYPLAHVLALGFAARRYDFEQEVLVRAAWHGVPLLARPIRVWYPPADQRVSHFHKWRDNGRIVWIYTRLMLRRLFWPVLRPRRRLVPPR